MAMIGQREPKSASPSTDSSGNLKLSNAKIEFRTLCQVSLVLLIWPHYHPPSIGKQETFNLKLKFGTYFGDHYQKSKSTQSNEAS